MAESVHPTAGITLPTAANAEALPSPAATDVHRPKLQPGAYVIQVPKDQVYRLPPPENADRFILYTRSAAHRRSRSSRRCLGLTLATLLLLFFSITTALGVLYLALDPKFPSYSIVQLSVAGLGPNFTSALSPSFSATVRASNHNKRFAIRYLPGGTATVSYAGVSLAGGEWPAFDQAKGNVTTVEVALRGSGVLLSRAADDELGAGRRSGDGGVKFELAVRAPAKMRLGATSSWKIDVKVRCDVTLIDVEIISQRCRVRMHI